MQQRRGDEILPHAEVLLGQTLELLGDLVEHVPVRARLPWRRNGLVEGVNERVKVRAGDVVLLIPRRRRQDDVRVERRAVHAEVDRGEEVELALRGLLAPADILRTAILVGLLCR